MNLESLLFMNHRRKIIPVTALLLFASCNTLDNTVEIHKMKTPTKVEYSKPTKIPTIYLTPHESYDYQTKPEFKKKNFEIHEDRLEVDMESERLYRELKPKKYNKN